MKKTNDCPSCVGFKAETRGRITPFTIGGVTHYAPDIWLGSRANRIGGDAMAAFSGAMHVYADQCAIAARHDAQREQAAA